MLVYTSAPFTEDLAVFGYIEIELFVASDAPDTDFTVKLVDVAPDDTAWNIADSIQRMRYRDGEATAVFMAPGEVYRISLPPMLAANVFLRGHRCGYRFTEPQTSLRLRPCLQNLHPGSHPVLSHCPRSRLPQCESPKC